MDGPVTGLSGAHRAGYLGCAWITARAARGISGQQWRWNTSALIVAPHSYVIS